MVPENYKIIKVLSKQDIVLKENPRPRYLCPGCKKFGMYSHNILITYPSCNYCHSVLVGHNRDSRWRGLTLSDLMKIVWSKDFVLLYIKTRDRHPWQTNYMYAETIDIDMFLGLS